MDNGEIMHTNQEEIDGSLIVGVEQHGESRSLTITEDGRKWFWEDTSWRVEPGTPLIPDGEWVECQP